MNIEARHESESNENEITHVQEKVYFLLDGRMEGVCSKYIHNDYTYLYTSNRFMIGRHSYIIYYVLYVVIIFMLSRQQ
jgi:hypothetical protein